VIGEIALSNTKYLCASFAEGMLLAALKSIAFGQLQTSFITVYLF